MTTLRDIDDFLNTKRVALVGVSRQEQDFTRSLFRAFVQRGYDVVPVNPNAGEVDGRACFRRLQDIAPRVEAALLMTPPGTTDAAVRDCVEAGVKQVWIYRGAPGVVRLCEENGLRVIANHCPFMFWKDSGWFHHLHGGLLKLSGRYPRKAC